MLKWRPRLKIYQGSNRKNTFNPETFEGRSYNHWLYVTKIKGKVVFNDYSYSMTTNKHQWEMKRFLRDDLKIKDIILVNQHASLSRGINLEYHYTKLILAELRMKFKGRKKSFYDEQKEIIKKMKSEIKMLKKLGAKLMNSYGDVVQVSDLRKELELEESDRLAKQREKSRAQREKHKQVMSQFKDSLNSTLAIAV